MRSFHPLLTTVICLAAYSSASAQVLRHRAERVPYGHLLVSGYSSETVHRYRNGSGDYAGSFGEAIVPGAQKILRGPEGLLYVVSEESASVLRFRKDGSYIDAFIFDDPKTKEDETGGLTSPTGAAFGPSGDFYVGDFELDNVLRYDGVTGGFIDVFVASNSGGLNGPDAGLTFAPNGELWVPSFYSDQVLRYSGLDGSHLGSFLGGALSRPRDIVIDGGDVFVSSWGNSRILRYDLSGDFQGLFLTTNRPTGIAFDPWDHDLFVTTDQNNRVRRYDGLTGTFEEVFVPPGTGGLAGATYLFWIDGGP